MGTNKRQRQEIEDMENLAAVLSTLDSLLGLIALHTRQPHLVREIEAGVNALERGRMIVFRRRRQLHEDAGG